MKNFKQLLKKYKIDGYIIPKNDEYFNEYVSSSTDRLKYISNFSGSAGFAIILKNKNYLFVDGRYPIQARNQSGKKFKVITIPVKFPKDVLKFKKETVIGFDPRLHTEKQLNSFFNIKNIKLRSIKQNLVDLVWQNKKVSSVKPFFTISSKNTGATSLKKVTQVQNILFKNKVDYLFVTAPENVAWILNIRGHDSFYSPVPNARLLISKRGELNLFANPRKLTILKKNQIHYYDESKIEIILSRLSGKRVWVDNFSCSFFYKNLLNRKNEIIEKIDPIHFLKSIKNNTEIKNMKKTHIADGVALTKFLIWLKKNFKRKKITEISAQQKLENFRKKNSSYKFPSFNTISGSGPNSAIIHYKTSNKTNRFLRRGELYLVDSGGR